ncbi:hypothetical protein ASC87_06975 [Rhizobacter sp. Root1221]|nr:hypothetical protein ASC87_06975 [Rhizobacter sp. Root1221]
MGGIVSITALILSREPVTMMLPAGVVALNHCETFTTTAGIHAARRRALARVRTEHVFFLDSDDSLPHDIADVLDECVAAGRPLAYTDELTVRPGMAPLRSRPAPYDPVVHAGSPLMVHHLALMQTAAALSALRLIPSGDVWIEHPLYWQVAQGGAAYVPRVGYHWHRRMNGMHRASGIVAAQARGTAWCIRRSGADEFKRRTRDAAVARAAGF